MDIQAIAAVARPKTGSRVSYNERRKGRIPAIIYGKKEPPVGVTVGLEDLKKVLKTGSHLVKLTLSGKEQLTQIREVAYDAITDAPIHVDFGRASLTEKLSVKVQLKTKGTSKAVVTGDGQMDILMSEIPIRCLPDRIPKFLEHDVAAMEIGNVVRLRELHLPEGVEIDGNVELLAITVHRRVEEVIATPEQTAAAAAVEPEVLTAKKEEEVEGAAAPAAGKPEAKPPAEKKKEKE